MTGGACHSEPSLRLGMTSRLSCYSIGMTNVPWSELTTSTLESSNSRTTRTDRPLSSARVPLPMSPPASAVVWLLPLPLSDRPPLPRTWPSWLDAVNPPLPTVWPAALPLPITWPLSSVRVPLPMSPPASAKADPATQSAAAATINIARFIFALLSTHVYAQLRRPAHTGLLRGMKGRDGVTKTRRGVTKVERRPPGRRPLARNRRPRAAAAPQIRPRRTMLRNVTARPSSDPSPPPLPAALSAPFSRASRPWPPPSPPAPPPFARAPRAIVSWCVPAHGACRRRGARG